MQITILEIKPIIRYNPINENAEHRKIFFGGQEYCNLNKIPVPSTDCNQACTPSSEKHQGIAKTLLPQGVTIISYDKEVFPPSKTTYCFARTLGGLTQQAMNRHSNRRNIAIVDAFTGSGVMAIAAAKQNHTPERIRILGTDVSGVALETARMNAGANSVVVSLQDVLKNVQGKFELVMGNPPYYHSDKVDPNFPAPASALDGGQDGLIFYRKFFEQARNIAADHGIIAVRIGEDILYRVWKIAKLTLPNRQIAAMQNPNNRAIGIVIGDFSSFYSIQTRMDAALGVPVVAK